MPSTVPKLWYHVACMGHWRDVVAEQLPMFARAGLKPTACVLGQPADVEYVRKLMPVAYSSPELLEYEGPTLEHLWHWCKYHDDDVMYVHTKGVSHQFDAQAQTWRRLMMHKTVLPWAKLRPKLQDHDAVGALWWNCTFSHFAGNFWMARNDWIRKLPSPLAYRYPKLQTIKCATRDAPSQFFARWWDRLFAETWIAARGDIRPYDTLPYDQPIGWNKHMLFRFCAGQPCTSIQTAYDQCGHLTDKGTAHSYLGFYEALLSPLRHKPVTIAEIGVNSGGSLDMWNLYFTHPMARIVGIDAAKQYIEDYPATRDRSTHKRVELVHADSRSPFAAASVESADIVIDDGSHDVMDQIATFSNIWPHVKMGGCYVIEDVKGDRAIAALKAGHPFEVHDLRWCKGRGDDIILLARKPWQKPA